MKKVNYNFIAKTTVIKEPNAVLVPSPVGGYFIKVTMPNGLFNFIYKNKNSGFKNHFTLPLEGCGSIEEAKAKTRNMLLFLQLQFKRMNIDSIVMLRII